MWRTEKGGEGHGEDERLMVTRFSIDRHAAAICGKHQARLNILISLSESANAGPFE